MASGARAIAALALALVALPLVAVAYRAGGLSLATADLAALRTHGTQHANLLAALNNTQGQGIDNSQHGNNHRNGKQAIQDGKHLVDKASRLACILLTRINLDHNQVHQGLGEPSVVVGGVDERVSTEVAL